MAIADTSYFPQRPPPADAKYVTQTADSTLSAEQSLGTLTTGLLLNTVTGSTGVLSKATYGTDYDIPRNVEETEAKRAYEALGTANLNFWFYPVSYVGTGGIAGASNSGSGAQSVQAGAYQLATGATANSWTRIFAFNDGADFGKSIRTGQNWYISARYKLTTAIDNQVIAFCGAGDSAGAQLGMGVFGSTSTTNFHLSGPSGTAINGGVAIDTAFHTHRAYRVGATTTYQIDTSTAVTGDVNIATDLTPYCYIQNGTTAAARTMQIVWICAASPSL